MRYGLKETERFAIGYNRRCKGIKEESGSVFSRRRGLQNNIYTIGNVKDQIG